MKRLEIKNISFSYNNDSVALDDVSFCVEKGKHIAILGHNGSGKSTLAKLLVGLLNPKKGEILVDGVAVCKKNINEIRKKIAIVFQNPDNQFICSTVEDDIAFGLENRQIPAKEMPALILDVAKKVGLEKSLKKEPSQLSGGQKQRVAIAGALVLNPEILILDEATSMLDPKGRSEIHNLILDMQNSNPNLTTISITHDIDEAILSDEVIVFEKGKVILKAPTKQLFSDEEKMHALGLQMPFISELKSKLSNIGIETSSDNLNEIAEKICQYK